MEDFVRGAETRYRVYTRGTLLVWSLVCGIASSILFSQAYLVGADWGLPLSSLVFVSLGAFLALFLLSVSLFGGERIPFLTKVSDIASLLVHGSLFLGTVLGLSSIGGVLASYSEGYLWGGPFVYGILWLAVFLELGMLLTRLVRMYFLKAASSPFPEDPREEGDDYEIQEGGGEVQPFQDVATNPEEGEDLSARIEGPGVEVIDATSHKIEGGDK